jgi:RNA polymerase sigma-70 factor (ECF subfamily)
MAHAFALAEGAVAESDDDLLVDAARQDPEAFGHLYRRHLHGVYRYLAARAASQEEAADLTQQVFLQAFQALERYRPGSGGFAPWLFRIARNAATDASRRRRPVVLLDEFIVAPSPSPEASALALERLRHLRIGIRDLPPAKQDLLALRFAAGLSSREIAVVVGKSEGSVKKQLTRTIQSLKEHYRDELPPQAR